LARRAFMRGGTGGVHQDTSVESKQLDDGIGDTWVPVVDAPSDL